MDAAAMVMASTTWIAPSRSAATRQLVELDVWF